MPTGIHTSLLIGAMLTVTFRSIASCGMTVRHGTIGQVSDRKTPFSLSGGGTKMIPIARPRIVVDGREIFYIFRDAERGSKVSMAHASDVSQGEWTVTDLTDFSVEAWEPSHDTELWKHNRRLHLFVQHTKQGDGERRVEFEPQPVYVLEVGN